MKISLRIKDFDTWAAFELNWAAFELNDDISNDFNFDYQNRILYFGGSFRREKAKVLARRMKLEKIK